MPLDADKDTNVFWTVGFCFSLLVLPALAGWLLDVIVRLLK